MSDSDEEYIGGSTEDEDDADAFQVAQRAPTARPTRSRRKKQRGGAEWEIARTWESLVEGVDGTISSTVEGLLEAGKRKR